MVITYFGKSFLKIVLGDLVIAANPYEEHKDKEHKATKFGADIALSSLASPDFNAIENASFADKTPFVARGPGEYEIGGGYIKGIHGGERADKLINTTYAVLLDGIRLAIFGGFNGKVSAEMKEELGEIDVLFIPVGGGSVLSPKDAYGTATFLEPKIIIPTQYEIHSGEKDALQVFLKEAGAPSADILPKLTIKKKDIEEKEGEVLVLADVS